MHKYTRQLRENRVFARDGTSGRKYASFRQSAHHADSQRLTPDTPVRSIFPRCRKASSALRKSLFGTLIMPVSHNNKSRSATRNGFFHIIKQTSRGHIMPEKALPYGRKHVAERFPAFCHFYFVIFLCQYFLLSDRIFIQFRKVPSSVREQTSGPYTGQIKTGPRGASVMQTHAVRSGCKCKLNAYSTLSTAFFRLRLSGPTIISTSPGSMP